MVAAQNFQNPQHAMTIGKHNVKRLDNIRTLLVDEKAIKFTPTEYHILLHLLAGKPVSDRELVLSIFHSRIEDDLWVRETLSRHLDNMRRKLRQSRVKIAIRRIATFGYILLPDVPFQK